MRGRPFKKGQPRPKNAGRKKGTPNKATLEIKEFFRGLFESPEYQESLRRRILKGKAVPIEALGLQYVGGKPKQVVEHSGPDGGPVEASVTFYIPENSRDRGGA